MACATPTCVMASRRVLLHLVGGLGTSLRPIASIRARRTTRCAALGGLVLVAALGLEEIASSREQIESFLPPEIMARHTVATIHSMDTPAPTIALHDLTAAYRFVASAHPQYGTFLIWNPAAGRARLEYYFMPGHPFGLTSSVVNFNRCSEAITAVARAHGISLTCSSC